MLIDTLISEDPIGFAGGDTNFYSYVGNNPVNLTDPMGLAAYMCTKPLNALGGAGVWAYKGAPLLYHQYICVVDGKVTTCGGQDRSGNPFYSPGKPSNDHFNKDSCEKKDDRSCMDECLTGAINNPNRPNYSLIGLGKQCQQWANASYAACMAQCKGK